MSESGPGTSVPAPGLAGVACALTCGLLAVARGQSSAWTPTASARVPLDRARRCRRPPARGGRVALDATAAPPTRSSRPSAEPASPTARGRRPPDRRPGPAGPELGDAGRGRADASRCCATRPCRPSGGRWLPLLTGYAVARALGRTSARLKWPNDVLDRRPQGLPASSLERVDTPAGPAGRGRDRASTSTRPPRSCPCRRPRRWRSPGTRSTGPTCCGDVLREPRTCARRLAPRRRRRSWQRLPRPDAPPSGTDVRVDLPGERERDRAWRPDVDDARPAGARHRRTAPSRSAPVMSCTCDPAQ